VPAGARLRKLKAVQAVQKLLHVLKFTLGRVGKEFFVFFRVQPGHCAGVIQVELQMRPFVLQIFVNQRGKLGQRVAPGFALGPDVPRWSGNSFVGHGIVSFR
jgi:hypothetical protein